MRSTVNQCRTMLVGSKRLQLAPASTTCPSAGSKFLIISICSRSSFDCKSTAKRLDGDGVIPSETIRVATVIATSARSTAVTEITDDAHGRRNDRHFEIMLINASGEKADRASIAAIVPVQSLNGQLHVGAGPTTGWSPIRVFLGPCGDRCCF